MAVIQLTDVNVTFKQKNREIVAVQNESITIEKGDIYGIVGYSGAGKSTLVRTINLLQRPTSGSVLVNGTEMTTLSPAQLRDERKKIGMIFQHFNLMAQKTAYENVAFALRHSKLSNEEKDKKIRDLLELVDLADRAENYPAQLSGGQKQRVAIARALANDPEILLMDEAFSALDPLIRREMQDELLDLQENVKKTIIFITHDLNEALRIGDRIALMKDGQIMQIGTGEEILTNPANEYVRTFVEDVDRSKVLTAQNIMVPALTTNIEIDGPTVALKRMRQEEVSMLLAVDKKRQLKGVVRAEKALEARKNGTSLVECVDPEIQTIDKDMLVNDIFPLIYDAQTPLAVTDNGKLLGVVIRGSVLEALAETEVNEHE